MNIGCRTTTPHVLRTLAVTVVGVAITSSAFADARDAELEKMKAMMQDMAKTIKTLQSEVATLKTDKDKDAAKRTAASSKASAAAPAKAPSSPASTAPVTAADVAPHTSETRDRQTFLDEQWPAPRLNNAPIDPNMKGFLQIPGTSTIFRLAGFARLDVIADDTNNGNPNKFIPSSFPVPGQTGAGTPSRTAVHAKASRFSFELRRAVGESNNLRIYYEHDFFGDSATTAMTFRLRHMYGQAWNWLVGYTNSNFMDIDAFPDVVDSQGPNGLVNVRQAQIRYTQPFGHHLRLSLAVEQPASQISTSDHAYGTGTSTVDRMPDFTGHLRYEDKKYGHIQLAGIYRYLSYDSDHGGQGVTGWGVNLSGALNLFAHDTLTGEVTYGEGIARYVQDPTGANLDAALNDNGDLRALPVLGAAVGYTHQWMPKWKSTVSYGYAWVDTQNINGGFAFDHSNYVSGNLIYQWSSSFRLGIEYLYGTKEVRNGAEHEGQRVNFVVKYDLVN